MADANTDLIYVPDAASNLRDGHGAYQPVKTAAADGTHYVAMTTSLGQILLRQKVGGEVSIQIDRDQKNNDLEGYIGTSGGRLITAYDPAMSAPAVSRVSVGTAETVRNALNTDLTKPKFYADEGEKIARMAVSILDQVKALDAKVPSATPSTDKAVATITLE